MANQRYFAWLLRVWQREEENTAVHYASLEDPHTGERLGFATLEALMTYVKKCMASTKGQNDQMPGDSL